MGIPRVRSALSFALVLSVLPILGCSTVQLRRFESATRIDLVANPGFAEYDEPFQSQYARSKQMRRAVCTDPAAIRTVLDTINQYEDGWANYWVIPPETPPIVLMFHNQTQWLGTLDVYEGALGHVHDLIHRIPKKEASKIVGTICDFAAETGNLRGPQPQGGRKRWSRTSTD